MTDDRDPDSLAAEHADRVKAITDQDDNDVEREICSHDDADRITPDDRPDHDDRD